MINNENLLKEIVLLVRYKIWLLRATTKAPKGVLDLAMQCSLLDHGRNWLFSSFYMRQDKNVQDHKKPTLFSYSVTEAWGKTEKLLSNTIKVTWVVFLVEFHAASYFFTSDLFRCHNQDCGRKKSGLLMVTL